MELSLVAIIVIAFAFGFLIGTIYGKHNERQNLSAEQIQREQMNFWTEYLKKLKEIGGQHG